MNDAIMIDHEKYNLPKIIEINFLISKNIQIDLKQKSNKLI